MQEWEAAEDVVVAAELHPKLLIRPNFTRLSE
jgi:hypothetical protein